VKKKRPGGDRERLMASLLRNLRLQQRAELNPEYTAWSAPEKRRRSYNGWHYRQGRDMAGKAARRRIRRLGPLPRKCGQRPHVSGARGVSPHLIFIGMNLDP